jgi:hypothetical protein
VFPARYELSFNRNCEESHKPAECVRYLTTLPISRLYRVYDRMINEYGAIVGLRIGRGSPSSQEICPSATVFDKFLMASESFPRSC